MSAHLVAANGVGSLRGIDLNADAGEGYDSPELFAAISSASIACGGHAGDTATMRTALRLAREHGLAVGAHPGYDDRVRFGRVETGDSAHAIRELVGRQVAELAEIARAENLPLAYVKPHGALYHRVSVDVEAAEALVAAVAGIDLRLAIVGFPASQLLLAARAKGFPALAEGFADRRYAGDGQLVSRRAKDALLAPAAAVEQALRLASEGRVQTICLHSDSPGAAALAGAIRFALEQASFVVKRPLALRLAGAQELG